MNKLNEKLHLVDKNTFFLFCQNPIFKNRNVKPLLGLAQLTSMDLFHDGTAKLCHWEHSFSIS